MNKIGEVIARHRKQMKLSQIDIAKGLITYDIHVKNAAVSSWEKGNTTPGAETFLALCEMLKISDIYTEFIGENPADPFRHLNEAGRLKALDYVDLLEKTGEFRKKTAEVTDITPRLMKIALIPASAGTGNLLDEENFEEVEVTDPVPAAADFGVHVSGDSMEPRFHDGELVWIEQTYHLNTGDIGLFFLDGMTYIKKYVANASGTFLVSLNVKYKPLEVSEYSNFKVFGRLAAL